MKAPSTADIRSKGQVWTPSWVADAMAVFLEPTLAAGALLDPAVGPGALVSAAWRVSPKLKNITAHEIDESALYQGRTPVLDAFPRGKMSNLVVSDYLFFKHSTSFSSVIANPPYIRHHRLTVKQKARGQEIAKATIGRGLDARAGIHVYFLLKALSELKPGGRLSFLLPADVVEGIFSEPLWRGITSRYRLKGILTFDGSQAAFPGVDTNAIIVFIENATPSKTYSRLVWGGENQSDLAPQVERWVNGKRPGAGLAVESRELERSLKQGLTRTDQNQDVHGVPFVELARVMRGIATGDNEYFVLTKSQILSLKLDLDSFIRCITRVRDLSGDTLTDKHLEKLDEEGRPTYLLNLNKFSLLTKAMRSYLEFGEKNGLATRPLIATRKPWYAMERRDVPPILFTYLGRRNNRFIRNRAKCVPLTGYLCVYPAKGIAVEKLLNALNHEDTWKCIAQLGKSYGSGAIKVEPGALRKLVIPNSALLASGLEERQRELSLGLA